MKDVQSVKRKLNKMDAINAAQIFQKRHINI